MKLIYQHNQQDRFMLTDVSEQAGAWDLIGIFENDVRPLYLFAWRSELVELAKQILVRNGVEFVAPDSQLRDVIEPDMSDVRTQLWTPTIRRPTTLDGKAEELTPERHIIK